ncbi:TAT-variant-translocated molybdopterin oxidoreductase [Rosistilla oblonga]|uniref:TAT-variant-translocated molybdopterin oxidoreductase n=1 Tax=Rosistilla oblonga TaxID=2527990 RepID=UPI003A97E451
MSETTEPKPRSRYWRSLNEIKQTPDFEQFMHREFPVGASEFPEGVSRRRWMKLMGASIALGTLSASGCRYAEETIAPFVIRPDGRVPGEPHFTATNIEWAGRVYNLLITGVDGRPIKVEANAQHPSPGVGTDPFIQASILQLYDPDRMDGVISRAKGMRNPGTDDWDTFTAAVDNAIGVKGFGAVRDGLARNDGKGFGILMPPTQSPSVVRLLTELQAKFPAITIGRYDAVRGDAMSQATEKAIGRVGKPILDLAAAKVICSIDADILGTDHGFIANAAGFADGRSPEVGKMNRLYSIESSFSNTGMAADTRYSLQPSQMPAFIAALEKQIDVALGGEASEQVAESEVGFDKLPPAEKLTRLIQVMANDLVASKGKALVVVGDHLGPEALAASIRLNHKLGSLGKTIRFAEPIDSKLKTVGLADFVAKLNSGDIASVVVLGGNPVFTSTGDIDVAAALAKASASVYVGEYDDETAVACQWVLPQAHPFESWGDCQTDDGFYGVTQPQILPLLNGKTIVEYLAWFLGEDNPDAEAIVRKTADAAAGESLSNRQWRQLLHDGFEASIKAELPAASYSGGDEPLTDAAVVPTSEYEAEGVDVVISVADGIYDGRFANNAWLQEMPQSVTKLTWDNAALMSPATAKKIGVSQNKMVALGEGDSAIELPVYELPGAAAGVVTVAMGYGRRRAGAVGGNDDLGTDPVGFDIAALRTSSSPLMAAGVTARPRSTTYELSTTQDHFAIDELGFNETVDRSHRLVREGTIEKLEKDPEFVKHMGVHSPALKSLWTEPLEMIENDGIQRPQWGMSIDLNRCVGCNACVVACQSENNIPIVGKEQVAMGREMHWIRVDRYFSGDPENVDESPQIVQQPVTCQHCETAPCEQVCPVAATVHTEEGINAMAYNRCIGTRYCANNCPYKVRRFNYFNFNEDVGTGYGIDAFPDKIENANRKLQQLVLNPDVSVRGRGVMEKCTYCIQRVERGKIEARKDGGRPIQDGDVVTACQQACPSKAIEFGNLADQESAVSLAHKDNRAYYMLDHLNVKPRTAYLARIRNTHHLLMTQDQLDHLAAESHGHGDHDAHGHDDAGHGEETGHGHGHEEKAEAKKSAMLPVLGDVARV